MVGNVREASESPLQVCSDRSSSACSSHPASVAERNWSVYGEIKSSRRTRLHHETADKLVYAHEALLMHRKVTDAGYKQEVEKWASDSDSDASRMMRLMKIKSRH